MSARSFRANQDLLAVSANLQETALNTEQTLDTSMLVDVGDMADLEPRRETNVDELTGKEEADTVYDLGNTSMVPLTFNKGQPQHFAFIMAYALGLVSTSAAGTGYEHTITPLDGDTDGERSLPTFTLGMRYGSTVLKRLFASFSIDSFVASFQKDSWLKITGQAKGTGKVTDNMYEETVSALGDAVSLTLAANAVEGATAAIRLANVQRIRVELTAGIWTEVDYTVVSAATPAVITIASAGGAATSFDYKILYIPDEPAWCTFPSRVVESPMRISQLTVNMGGAWDGSDFNGGRTMDPEITGVDWEFQNNNQVEFIPGVTGAYAGRIFRDGRTQTLKFNREFRDYIIQQHKDDNDTFGIHLVATGAIFDGAHAYQVEIIFPKCAVIAAPITADGKRLAESGDFIVLQDDTYGSVIVKIKNLQATYAA